MATILFLDQLCVTMLLPVLPDLIRTSLQDNATSSASSNTSVPLHLLGLVFGVKGIAQLVSTPLVGALIDHTCPFLALAVGLTINSVFLSLYALDSRITILFLCRCLQGVTSSALLSAVFAEIAQLFPHPNNRRKLTAIANVATFVGGAVGPFYGGAAYQVGGQTLVFFLPFALIFFSVILMLIGRKRFCRAQHAHEESLVTRKQTNQKPNPIYKLLADPLILITTLGIVVANFCANCWFATLPTWMKSEMGAEEWAQGVVWTPTAIFYVAGAGLAILACQSLPRHRHVIAFATFVLCAAHTLALSFLRHLVAIAYVLGISTFSTAVIEVILFPVLPNIVDARYNEVYGSVSSLTPAAFSCASIFGSFFAGILTEKCGFFVLNISIAATYLLFAPLVFLLRKFC